MLPGFRESCFITIGDTLGLGCCGRCGMVMGGPSRAGLFSSEGK